MDADMPALVRHLAGQGILVSSGDPMRLVTHLDISGADVDLAVEGFRSFFSGQAV
jgi:threonine aldolase